MLVVVFAARACAAANAAPSPAHTTRSRPAKSGAPAPTTPTAATRTAKTKPGEARSAAANRSSKPERAGWKVIESRGRAYIDLADVARFFGFANYKRDGSKILLSRKEHILDGRKLTAVEWRAQVGSKLVSLNTLRLYLSYPVVSGSGGKVLLSAFDLVHVIDPILRPDQQREPSQVKVVVIDPARGGEEEGVSTRFGKEKDVTLDVARRVKAILERNGYRAFLTREADTQLAVDERLMLANSMREEAVFVSLHCSYGSDHERGIETFTLAPSGTPTTSGDEGRAPDQKFYPGNINDRESMALATALQGPLVNQLKATDLGIRRARFDELKGISMPGVVSSIGRLAHSEEGRKLGTDPAYRQRVAEALFHGLHRYARVMASGLEPRDQTLKFAQVQVLPDKVRSLTGEQVRVRAAIAKTAPDAVIDPRKVALQVYFLDFVNNEEIDLSACDTPQANWLSVTPNWSEANYEEVEFTYKQPAYDEAMLKHLGRRTYYGFVLRLIYNDELMDEHADPSNLKRGLGNFTSVLPRRR